MFSLPLTHELSLLIFPLFSPTLTQLGGERVSMWGGVGLPARAPTTETRGDSVSPQGLVTLTSKEMTKMIQVCVLAVSVFEICLSKLCVLEAMLALFTLFLEVWVEESLGILKNSLKPKYTVCLI